DRPETVKGAMVGGDFFRILRTPMQLGRAITGEDDQPGHGKVVVISDGFWKSHFGSSASALGRTLILEDEPYSIIGVAQPALHFPAWIPAAADVWLPLAWDTPTRAIRNNHNFVVVGRLKPGVTLARAQAEMNTI